MKFIFLILIVLHAPSAPAKGRLFSSYWTCNVPCEANDDSSVLRTTISFAYCGDSVLSPVFIDSMTPLCKSVTGDNNVRASRANVVTASCQNTGAACDQIGIVPAPFKCSVMCPGNPYIEAFSACALTSQEAWETAPQHCIGSQPPPHTPLNKVCQIESFGPCALN
jgi:hypothetical protein